MVEHLMGEFMSQNGEFLGRRHVRNQPNFASGGNSLGWGNGLVVFHRDSLFGNELLELVREFPGVTRGLRKLGQRLAFGLLDIEDESGTESGQPKDIVLLSHGLIWMGRLERIFPLFGEHGRKDHDPLLTALNVPPQVPPSVVAGHVGCVRPLRRDQENVAPAVAMKRAHGGKVTLESFAFPGLQFSCQVVQGVFCQLSYSIVGHDCTSYWSFREGNKTLWPSFYLLW